MAPSTHTHRPAFLLSSASTTGCDCASVITLSHPERGRPSPTNNHHPQLRWAVLRHCIRTVRPTPTHDQKGMALGNYHDAQHDPAMHHSIQLLPARASKGIPVLCRSSCCCCCCCNCWEEHSGEPLQLHPHTSCCGSSVISSAAALADAYTHTFPHMSKAYPPICLYTRPPSTRSAAARLHAAVNGMQQPIRAHRLAGGPAGSSPLRSGGRTRLSQCHSCGAA